MIGSKTLLLVVSLVAVVAIGGTAAPARSAARSEKQLTTLNRQIASAINAYRKAHHLVQLRLAPGLNAVSRQHSEEMGSHGYFDHPSADGTAFWKRIQNYYTSTSYRYWTVGENLLWDSSAISAAGAMKNWIASPEHRRNLLDKSWRNLGVSAVQVTNAGGIYGGNTVTIITTDFGARH